MLFIAGSGRSGTTWLAKLFDSHPDVLYRHEPDTIVRNHDLPFHPSRDDLDQYKEDAARYLERLKAVRAPKTALRPPAFAKTFRSSFGSSLHRLTGLIVKGYDYLGLPGSQHLVVPDFFASGREAEHMVIKSVSSVGRMALFAQADPTAKFIHVLRHPAAVVASTLRAMESGVFRREIFLHSAMNLPEAARYPFTLEALERKSQASQLAAAWMIFNDKAAEDMAGSARYQPILYERLCCNLEPLLAELFSFSGIEWRQETTDFIDRLKNAPASEESHFNIMRPPTASLTRWRKSLTQAQIEEIANITRHARSEPVRSVLAFTPPN